MEILNGMNKNTNMLLFNDDFDAHRCEELTDKESIFIEIDKITKLSDDEIKKKLRFNFKLRKKDNIFTIKKRKLKYNFKMMDDYMESNQVKEELRSDERYRKCGEMAISIAYSVDENVNIIIGYLNMFNGKIIHSVIERFKDSESYIFDYTRNLVMRKEDYFDITNFKVLNIVKNSDLKKDIELLRGLNIYTKPYLIFRDEMMRDLNKCVKRLKLEE